MKAKRWIALLTAVMMSLMIAGCSAEPAANTEPSSEQPSPTATPKTGIEAVFDKPVNLAIVSNTDDAASAMFFEAATKEAESMGVTVTSAALGSGFDAGLAEATASADAVVAFLPEALSDYAALEALQKPVAVYETSKSNVPAAMAHLSYEADTQLSMALEAALNYPPHEAPVRLILLFESADSPAYAAYQQLYTEGKVFPKEVYVATADQIGAGEWITAKMEGYVAGMLDAVFAENEALALSAYDALAALSRNDMEVFCPGVNADIVSRMQSNPDVFAQAIGRNDVLAGVLSVRAALQMLHGGEAVTQAFAPAVINAADLGDDAISALAAMDSEKAALYNADWMDTLRSFYSTAADAADSK